MQAALDAVSEWATEKYVKVSASKSVALRCTLDPGEGPTKASAPRLSIGGTGVEYSRPTILGVTLDAQMRFGHHAKAAAKKLSGRTNIIRALAGTRWGSHPSTLRTLYNSYVKPAGMYAAGVWYPFLAKTNRAILERQQNRAGRAEMEAAKLWVSCARRPPDHPLHSLAQTPPWSRRLKAGQGLRSSWREEAQQALERLPEGWLPDPWPPPESTPCPGKLRRASTSTSPEGP